MSIETPFWRINQQELRAWYSRYDKDPIRRIKRPWNPVDVYFGIDVSKDLNRIVKDVLKRNYVFFAADKYLAENTELVKNLRKNLEVANDLYIDIEPEPKIEVAERISDAVRSGNYDCVVGVGGGSVLDMAKIAAVMKNHSGKAQDYLGSDKFKNSALPLILIPTTAGTGSEVTNRAMVTADEKTVFADDRLYAKITFVDPKLTLTLPPKVTLDTTFDALSHATEVLLSKQNIPYLKEIENDAYSSIQLINENLEVVMKNGKSMAARENLSMASVLAGEALSIKKMVYPHSMGYSIANYKIPHGRATIIFLPYVMAYYLQDEESVKKMSNIARRIGVGSFWNSKEENAKRAIRHYKDLIDRNYNRLGIPITLDGIGIKESDEYLAKFTLERWPRDTSPVKASIEDMIRLFKQVRTGELEV